MGSLVGAVVTAAITGVPGIVVVETVTIIVSAAGAVVAVTVGVTVVVIVAAGAAACWDVQPAMRTKTMHARIKTIEGVLCIRGYYFSAIISVSISSDLS